MSCKDDCNFLEVINLPENIYDSNLVFRIYT